MTLEEIIKQHIRLPSRSSATGWYPVLCKVCNDHGRKGPRAGFRFDNGAVGYHCFNCEHAALFDPSKHKTIPKNMEIVLEAFGINKDEWQRINFEQLSREEMFKSDVLQNQQQELEPSIIKLPEWFTRLDENVKDEISLYAIEWLKYKRGINYKDYPFYIGNIRSSDPNVKKWYGRLIIPIYKDGNVVFYMGRDLTGMRTNKYLSVNISKQNIIQGYEFIKQKTDDPLYIVEGWFDAFHINGVAVLGRKMSRQQIAWINQSTRDKVIIPDRFGRGYDLALQGLREGWKISTPDFGDDIKDINDAVVRYGVNYVLITINKNIKSGFEAETSLRVYCKK